MRLVGALFPSLPRPDLRLEEASFHAVGGYQFGRHFRTDFRAGILQPHVGNGTDDDFPGAREVFTDEEVAGLKQQPDYFRFSSSLVIDYRDHLKNAQRGIAAAFSYARFEDLDGDLFQFNRYSLEVRGYVPVHTNQHVIAGRFHTSLNDPDDGSRVPFYYMQTLGGDRTLRGFSSFRFRDEDLLHFTAEYRWGILSYMEVAGFYDAGKVFANESDFGFGNLEDSYGGGVRLKFPEHGVLFRFEIARSREDTRFLLHVGPSF